MSSFIKFDVEYTSSANSFKVKEIVRTRHGDSFIVSNSHELDFNDEQVERLYKAITAHRKVKKKPVNLKTEAAHIEGEMPT